LKSSSQCVAAAKSANRILGMISRTFVNKDSKTVLKLYQSLVRPKSANRILGMISRTFVNKDSKTVLKLYQSLVRPKLVRPCTGMETLLAKGYRFAGKGTKKEPHG